MEIKTEFLDEYTNKIDMLLAQCQNQKHDICTYSAFSFWVCRLILSKINLFFLASS